MNKDVECPYCKEWQEIEHDDGQGYEDGPIHEQECSDCEKTFGFTTSIEFYYDGMKLPCANGAPHKWKQSGGHIPQAFPDYKRCEYCELVDQGKYVASPTSRIGRKAKDNS